MAESHVVSGLVAKRSELAGLIQHYQNEIGKLSVALSHIDHTIKLFAPEYDLKTISVKKVVKRNQYLEHGEAQRLSLNILRQAGRPLTSKEITDEIMYGKGIEPSQGAVHSILKAVLICLRRMEKKGILISSVEINGRKQIRFSIKN